MIRIRHALIIVLAFFVNTLNSQEKDVSKMENFDFLVGEWNITNTKTERKT